MTFNTLSATRRVFWVGHELCEVHEADVFFVAFIQDPKDGLDCFICQLPHWDFEDLSDFPPCILPGLAPKDFKWDGKLGFGAHGQS